MKLRHPEVRWLLGGMFPAQVQPAAIQNRRLCLSPIDALIYLVAGCRLRRQIRVRRDLGTLAHLHITTVLPQRRPACRGDVKTYARFGGSKSQNSYYRFVSQRASQLFTLLTFKIERLQWEKSYFGCTAGQTCVWHTWRGRNSVSRNRRFGDDACQARRYRAQFENSPLSKAVAWCDTCPT